MKFNIFLSIFFFVSSLNFPAFAGFKFEDADQRDLNKWVAKTGMEIYRDLNNNDKFSYPSGNSASNYFTSSHHWEVFAPFMEPMVVFIKRKGVSASESLKSLLTSEAKFECRIAQEIVFLECVRRLIGDEYFDRFNEEFEKEPSSGFYQKGSTKEFWLGSRQSYNPYFRLTSQENGSLHHLGKIGYFGYTPNIKEYEQLHPQGALRGDNGLLCSDEKNEEILLYTGFHKPFYKKRERRWDEIVVRFKEETLTPSIPKEIIIDTNNIPESRVKKYIENKKNLHMALLQRHEELIKSLENNYEEKLINSQKSFLGPAFFIDLQKVKEFLNI